MLGYLSGGDIIGDKEHEFGGGGGGGSTMMILLVTFFWLLFFIGTYIV